MEEVAYAKINLALHVRGREPDGYHRIETIFAFVDDGDRLRVEPGEGLTLEVSGPFAAGLSAGEDNLVLRAAGALAEAYGVRGGATLLLDKRLPVASGIGGGSADAAAALRLLARWWGLPAREEDLVRLAMPLGADVPACVVSRTRRGEGRGDELLRVTEDWSGKPVLLVNPGVAVSTGAVFSRWNGMDLGPLGSAAEGRNDLEPIARQLAPEIELVMDALAGMKGVELARMSGSGATCFAIFADHASLEGAEQRVRKAHPGWWTMAGRLR
jgi:4-diphosphocytidyl-2-C-methyl-D-erythritol kinase